MKLYNYFRSSASYRVRIALRLKGLDHQLHTVHLVKDGGQQHDSAYVKLNPQHLVPTLITEKEHTITQSIAIIEYLDECYPTPPLLPSKAEDRANVRALSMLIACDTHPLNNLKVLNYLKNTLNISEEEKSNWYHHWILEGFHALERHLENYQSIDFCYGDTPSLADLCLIPQVYNAKRFHCPLDAFPRINQINAHCLSLPEFNDVSPDVMGE